MFAVRMWFLFCFIDVSSVEVVATVSCYGRLLSH